MSLKYVIAVPHMGSIHPELAKYLLSMSQKYGSAVSFIFRSQNPVSVNRNALVEEFLKTEAEWLLFIDDDMNPKSDLLEMSNYDKPVIQAVTCIMQNNIPQPLIMKKVEGTEEILFKQIELSDLDNLENGLIEVDGVGTGCLLINRSVFSKLKKPYFKFEMDEEGLLKLSEDFYFSQKCKENNINLYVDSKSHCGHIKRIDLYNLNHMLYEVGKRNIKSDIIGDNK